VANGNSYPAVQLDAKGNVVDSGTVIQFTDSGDEPGSGSGGLAFTGWTEDASNPANVDTNGGSLTASGGIDLASATVTAEGGTATMSLGATALQINNSAGSSEVQMDSQNGFYSLPQTGQTAYVADGGAGATVALDAGGLAVDNVGTLTAATVDATTAALTPGTPGDDVLFCNDGAISGFSTIVPNSVPAITGALSTVIDAPAKAVLTSIISALTTLGLATDSTT